MPCQVSSHTNTITVFVFTLPNLFLSPPCNPRRSCNDGTLSASLACDNQERVLVPLGMAVYCDVIPRLFGLNSQGCERDVDQIKEAICDVWTARYNKKHSVTFLRLFWDFTRPEPAARESPTGFRARLLQGQNSSLHRRPGSRRWLRHLHAHHRASHRQTHTREPFGGS